MNKMWTCYASGTRWALNHAVATVALEHDLTTILDFPEKCIWSIICVILSTYHIVKLATLSSLYMSIVAINGKLGNINSEFFYRLEKLNLRRTLGERKMSDFPSGVWERGKSKGWNWVFRLLGIFWMWILPESATGTSKRFAPKINSVRFFIVKHTSLARPFWQSSSERNVFVIILTRSKTSVLLLTNRQRHNSLQCFTEVLF